MAARISQLSCWSVIWVASNGKKRKLVRKDFGDDLASAEELYHKVRDAGRQAVTLACVNMGFPPPKELRPHVVRKRGRDKRTKKIRTVEVEVQPLRELNRQGKLWCPYCRRLRPFVLKKYFILYGIRVNDPRYCCPICGISHKDHYVRVWNPTATMHMEASLTVVRGPRRTKPVRRKRRSR